MNGRFLRSYLPVLLFFTIIKIRKMFTLIPSSISTLRDVNMDDHMEVMSPTASVSTVDTSKISFAVNRATLVYRMFHIVKNMELPEYVSYSAVHVFDSYIRTRSVAAHVDYNLVAISAIWLATKWEQDWTYDNQAKNLLKVLTGKKYLLRDLMDMDIEVITALQWKITPSLYVVIHDMLEVLPSRDLGLMCKLCVDGRLHPRLICLMDIVLLDVEFYVYSTTVLLCSAMFLLDGDSYPLPRVDYRECLACVEWLRPLYVLSVEKFERDAKKQTPL